jgi:hypothetical protein
MALMVREGALDGVVKEERGSNDWTERTARGPGEGQRRRGALLDVALRGEER